MVGNRIGYQAWLQFYKKNMPSRKAQTYMDFIKSPYYGAFAKFGAYCASINAINVLHFSDWLSSKQVKIDNWCADTHYTKYLIEYLKTENPFDALSRSVETTMSKAEEEGIQSKDYLRYGNPNKICYAITTGKISPWMLYQCDSGIHFLDTLNPDHVKMIIDYISPDQWAVKFHRQSDDVKHVKEILRQGGY